MEEPADELDKESKPAGVRSFGIGLNGVEHPEAGVALRGAFIIDKKGIVRSQIVNDLPLGRNMDELLRLIDALQFHEAHGDVCPAGWNKGDTGIKPTSHGIANFLSEKAEDL